MLDYPKQVSTVLFVGTCNWRCTYCQNLPLLAMEDIDFNNNILPKLIKRKKMISHIIISGGECLYDPNIENYIDKLKENGFSVGIHTNGYNYNKLTKIIDKIDFIGMDVKTSIDEYKNITNSKNIDTSNILNSLKLISEKDIIYDIRTTLYPKNVGLYDLIEICKILESLNITEYNIQKYNPIRDDEFNYSNEDIENISKLLKEKFKNIEIKTRGMI